MAVKRTAYPEQGLPNPAFRSRTRVDSAVHRMGGRVRAVIGDGVEVQRAVRREAEHAVGDGQVQGGVG